MMTQKKAHSAALAMALAVSICVTSPAFAYDEKDAISDCESKLNSEYNLNDFRHQSAQRERGEGHRYEVTGETKIDGEKHPFTCRIDDRRVTSISYSGPEPEKLGTAEKLAIGAAAVIAAGVAVSEMNKDDEEKGSSTEQEDGSDAGGEMEQDGFYYDKQVGKWRDPGGEICHTCTPENGFATP